MPTLRLIVLLAAFCVVQTTALQHLRRSLSQSVKNISASKQEEMPEDIQDGDFECDFVLGHIRYHDGSYGEWNACMVDHVVYNLPEDVPDTVKSSGRLRITGGQRRRSHDAHHGDEITDATSVQVVPQGRTGNTVIKSLGNSTTLVVRITSLDSNVTVSADDLRASVFEGEINVALQMERCSAGKLRLVPAQGRDIHGGVAELHLPVKTRSTKPWNLHGVIRDAFELKFGSQNDYNHLIYCLPEGTGEGWIAYAFTDTPLSFYHDKWCASLTSVMHELGHNMGVGHSGEGDEGNYEDRTCVMGVSFRRRDGPQECFNGARHWSLGWFADRQVAVDPVADGPWGGYLAAFVDYTDVSNDMYVIVKITTEGEGDLYAQYNRAKKHNWEVEEKANQVTIVKSGANAGSVTAMLAGIYMDSSSYSYTDGKGNEIVIEICESRREHNVDYMKISVHKSGDKSTCICQDSEENFSVLGQQRNCSWFVENEALGNIHCEMNHDVRRNCPVTCDSCGDPVQRQSLLDNFGGIV